MLRRPSAGVRREPWISPTARVLVLVAALLAVCGAGWAAGAVAARPPYIHPELPWWLLTALFGAAEVHVLHVQSKREARTISLSEIPLVLGLFFATPVALVVARLVGPLVVFALHRRQQLLKLAFNGALLLTEAITALGVFALLLGDAEPAGVRSWLAAYGATTLAGIVGAVLVAVAIALYESAVRVRELAAAARSGAFVGLVLTTLALVAVNALVRDSQTALLLVLSAVVLAYAYRAYASLVERHLSLERLYRFSQVVSSSPEVDEILGSVLAQARELLRAEYADITVLSVVETGTGVRVEMGRGDRLERSEVEALTDGDWVCDRVLSEATPMLLPKGARDARVQVYLRRRKLRDAIVVPLRGEAGIVGTLAVGDRMGDVRTFDHADVRLLETVAAHASMALQNGRLVGRLRHEALHDALTGLANRTLLQRRAREALDEITAGRSPGAAVMIMDLDGFKEVNDTLGHQNGDVLLREVADRMTAALGPAATVARLGGDEFAVLLPNVPDAPSALHVARRVVTALEHPVAIDELEIQVAGSIGVALAPLHTTDVSELLKKADVAMYAAKLAANGVQLFQPNLDKNDRMRLTLVSELRQAVQRDEFELYVQPKASLATGDVTGVEALVRWRHPRRGLVWPDEFVPVAERSGLIMPLTRSVLAGSISACAEWQRTGMQIGIAVNLSTRNLLDLELVDEVRRLLNRYDLAAERLTLEITESTLMSDPARAAQLLERLGDMGVRISIDDFGTGYSSLSYLRRLPVHELKIDRSFVTDIEATNEVPIVRSILDLAERLSLQTVAEGVETQIAWDRLCALGCDHAQGYQLSRPMPIETFPSWLRRYRLERARRRPMHSVG